MTDLPHLSAPYRELSGGLAIDVDVVVISGAEAAAVSAAQAQALWEVWSWWSETTQQPQAS